MRDKVHFTALSPSDGGDNPFLGFLEPSFAFLLHFLGLQGLLFGPLCLQGLWMFWVHLIGGFLYSFYHFLFSIIFLWEHTYLGLTWSQVFFDQPLSLLIFVLLFTSFRSLKFHSFLCLWDHLILEIGKRRLTCFSLRIYVFKFILFGFIWFFPTCFMKFETLLQACYQSFKSFPYDFKKIHTFALWKKLSFVCLWQVS